MINKYYDDLKRLQYSQSTDTIIKVRDKIINVHSFILVGRSEFFKEMINF